MFKFLSVSELSTLAPDSPLIVELGGFPSMAKTGRDESLLSRLTNWLVGTGLFEQA